MAKCMGDFGIHIKDVAKRLEVKMGAYASDATVQGDGSIGTTDTSTESDDGLGGEFSVDGLGGTETTTQTTETEETTEETVEGDGNTDGNTGEEVV